MLTPGATSSKGSSETSRNRPVRQRRFDVLWQFQTLVFLALYLAFSVSLTRRFWAGGPSAEGFLAIVFPILWIFFVIWLTITPKGQQVAVRLLNDLRVPEHWLNEAICLMAMLPCTILMILYLQFPQIADSYHSLGLKAYEAGQLSVAEADFKIAIAFNPEHAGARYGMAKLYENQNNRIAARQEY